MLLAIKLGITFGVVGFLLAMAAAFCTFVIDPGSRAADRVWWLLGIALALMTASVAIFGGIGLIEVWGGPLDASQTLSTE
jgi:hypothetical protein